ncbi:tumor necrosis factor receptor superfamily member 14 isoform X3 [Chelonia mydas]|uniref:tumor necrosis factor receptor superfamily member 14 isoform X3 n=1 Tax=Chelonia mydas TaxID=8469 RepID=UPI001CA9DE81|nr:tumor necrosis factor receptor superfamily member 14 isoform X3 [Chelonia mydas]
MPWGGQKQTHSAVCSQDHALGNRVVRHCRLNSSTTCMPCVDDTYTEHPNGLTECMRCKLCDAGARLIIKEKCTYMKNTMCGCAPGDFCRHFADGDCEMCSPSTICLPGSMVKEPGTEFRDNVCEVCPDGTFSATKMSRACQPWTKCEEEGMTELKAGTATSNAVCVQRGLSVTAMTSIIVLAVLSVFAGTAFFLWRRKKRKYGLPPAQETGDESKGQAERTLLQTSENGTENMPTQEQTKARAEGEERKPLSALHV